MGAASLSRIPTPIHSHKSSCSEYTSRFPHYQPHAPGKMLATTSLLPAEFRQPLSLAHPILSDHLKEASLLLLQRCGPRVRDGRQTEVDLTQEKHVLQRRQSLV